MDFALTETQRDIAAAARGYLADTYPVDRVAAIADGPGTDAAAWPKLVRQGWLDDDLGMVELGLLAQESGYALHPTAWWATAALTGQRQASTLVTGAVRARQVGDGWRLSGRADCVPDAGAAAELLVRADTAYFTVDRADTDVRARASLDPLRRMYEVDLRDVPGRPASPPGEQRAAALLACEAVGVAARALDFAVDHAKVREQFGRPIGSFQAVSHQLVDGYVDLELARSLALRAAWLVGCPGGDHGDDNGPGVREAAVACAVVAGRRAAVRCCEVAMQTLGGMGVTWEHPLHLWFRRALWLESFPLPGPDPHSTVAAAALRDATSMTSPETL